MNVLGLPGRHPANGPWMEQILSGLELADAQVHGQYYRFWQQTNTPLEPAYELSQAAAFNPELVIAKSVGTVLSALGIHQQLLTPRALVFIGLPLSGLGETELAWFGELADLPLPKLFIQQTSDPGIGFAQLAQTFQQGEHLTLVEVPGDDHIYADVGQLCGIINRWLAKAMPLR